MENHAGSSSRAHPYRAREAGLDLTGWLTLGPAEVPQDQKQAPRQVHACLYCSRTFLSSQALGGHQHYHRRERERRDHLANMFPPTNHHVPNIIPMLGPIVRVEPPAAARLGLGLGLGLNAGMNPGVVLPPNGGYQGLLERRLGIRHGENERMLERRLGVGDAEDVEEIEDDQMTEVTVTCTELKNMNGHESGDWSEGDEGGAEVSSQELDLTLRL